MTKMADATWWVVSDEALSSMLKRAQAGEDPDTLRLELYVNSDAAPVD